MSSSYVRGRTPPIEPSAKLLYSSGPLMSSLSLVTVLGVEDTERADFSAFLELGLVVTQTVKVLCWRVPQRAIGAQSEHT